MKCNDKVLLLSTYHHSKEQDIITSIAFNVFKCVGIVLENWEIVEIFIVFNQTSYHNDETIRTNKN